MSLEVLNPDCTAQVALGFYADPKTAAVAEGS